MLAIITYDAPHRKTQDLVSKLIMKGYGDIELVVIPWVERKNHQPLLVHRPSNAVQISTEELCERFNIKFTRVLVEDLNLHFEKVKYNHIFIGGAGILPEDLVKNHQIINSHPGYLPNMKGLDSFKWAIYNEQPIGVTTHYVSEKTDEGLLIEKNIVPVFCEDSFHSVAYRVYETELQMLAESIEKIENHEAPLELLVDENFDANRRMPNRLEPEMLEKFEELRKISPSRMSCVVAPIH